MGTTEWQWSVPVPPLAGREKETPHVHDDFRVPGAQPP
jgi:hypothetical protein